MALTLADLRPSERILRVLFVSVAAGAIVWHAPRWVPLSLLALVVLVDVGVALWEALTDGSAFTP